MTGSALPLGGGERAVPAVVGDGLPDPLGSSGQSAQLIGCGAEAHDLAARVVEAGPAGSWAHTAQISGHKKSLTTPIYAATVSRVGDDLGTASGEAMSLNHPNTGCLCGDGCISAYDNQPCDCFCDGDADGKHHYDYLDDVPAPHARSCRCDTCQHDAMTDHQFAGLA